MDHTYCAPVVAEYCTVYTLRGMYSLSCLQVCVDIVLSDYRVSVGASCVHACTNVCVCVCVCAMFVFWRVVP